MSVVFYFMNGCPACHATWPAWRKVKKMAKGRMREVEMKQIPPGVEIHSFPTFVVEDETGMVVKKIVGSRKDPAELMRELGLRRKTQSKTRSKTRRFSRPGATRRKIR
jgi:hypothetical protein